MALLLSLETSTHSFSCALHHERKLLAFKQSQTAQATASLLTVMIEEMFSELPLEKHQLKGVVVASGPGSYTGLRIGVATAKGICYALSIPLFSVNTLSLLTHQFIEQFSSSEELKDALLCPMLDARRMEVYCMLSDKNQNIIEPIQAKIIDAHSFNDQLSKHVIYFFGEGSDKCRNLIFHPDARFIADVKPLAAYLGVIGFQKYLNKETENIVFFEPLYLKDFVIKKPKLIS